MGTRFSTVSNPENGPKGLFIARERAASSLLGGYIGDAFTTSYAGQPIKQHSGGDLLTTVPNHSAFAEEAYPLLTSLAAVGNLDVDDVRRETVKHYRYCKDSRKTSITISFSLFLVCWLKGFCHYY
jgi:hypothetical protein